MRPTDACIWSSRPASTCSDAMGCPQSTESYLKETNTYKNVYLYINGLPLNNPVPTLAPSLRVLVIPYRIRRTAPHNGFGIPASSWHASCSL